MKIKYELKITFQDITCITPCPNGYWNVKVHSKSCIVCNFYKKNKIYKREIICIYDKYNNKKRI